MQTQLFRYPPSGPTQLRARFRKTKTEQAAVWFDPSLIYARRSWPTLCVDSALGAHCCAVDRESELNNNSNNNESRYQRQSASASAAERKVRGSLTFGEGTRVTSNKSKTGDSDDPLRERQNRILIIAHLFRCFCGLFAGIFAKNLDIWLWRMHAIKCHAINGKGYPCGWWVG